MSRQPPFSRDVLQRWVQELARQQGIVVVRLQRRTREVSQPVGDTPALRINLKLAYKGRSWSTVQLEVSPAEGNAGAEIDRIPAFDIGSLGLEGPAEIPCLPLRYQLAQKLHACTEVFDEGPDNARFRDLIDILLLRSLVEGEALAGVRAACDDVFSVRGKHSWPPSLLPPSWRDPYARLADETGFGISDVDDGAAAVRAVIAEIDGATGTVRLP